MKKVKKSCFKKRDPASPISEQVFFIYNFKGTFSEIKRLTNFNLSGTY